MIDVAEDVARHVADDEANDAIVDSSLTAVDSRTDSVAQLARGHSPGFHLPDVDNAASAGKLVELVSSCSEVVLDEAFCSNALLAKPLFSLLVHLAPDVRARVLDCAGVERVRRELLVHVVVSRSEEHTTE